MKNTNWDIYFEALKKQDWEKAKKALQQISESDRQNPQVYIKLGDVFQRTCDTKSAVASYLVSARLLRSNGFIQKAIAIYKIILRLEPSDQSAQKESQELLAELENQKTFSPPLSPPTPIQMKEAKREVNTDKISVDIPHGIQEVRYSVDDAGNKELEQPLDTQVLQQVCPPFDTYCQKELVPPPEHSEEIQESSHIFDDFKKMEEAPTVAENGEKADELPRIPELFSDMSPEEFSKALERLEQYSFATGEKIVEEGDSGDSLYLIKSGKARVVAHLMGKKVELALLEAGDLFGEVAFLTGRPRTATVITDCPAEVYIISRLDIENIIERNPSILAKMEDFYQRRVKDTIKKVMPG